MEPECAVSISSYNESINSSNSIAKIRIKRAFDRKSKSCNSSKGSSKKSSRFNNSVTSEMSNKSLKKIHTFNYIKSFDPSDKDDEEEETKKGSTTEKRNKVYYVEEQVKVLSGIIAQADPILNELVSQIH